MKLPATFDERPFWLQVLGGLVYGSLILIGHETATNEPRAHLPDPQAGLVLGG